MVDLPVSNQDKDGLLEDLYYYKKAVFRLFSRYHQLQKKGAPDAFYCNELVKVVDFLFKTDVHRDQILSMAGALDTTDKKQNAYSEAKSSMSEALFSLNALDGIDSLCLNESLRNDWKKCDQNMREGCYRAIAVFVAMNKDQDILPLDCLLSLLPESCAPYVFDLYEKLYDSDPQDDVRQGLIALAKKEKNDCIHLGNIMTSEKSKKAFDSIKKALHFTENVITVIQSGLLLNRDICDNLALFMESNKALLQDKKYLTAQKIAHKPAWQCDLTDAYRAAELILEENNFIFMGKNKEHFVFLTRFQKDPFQKISPAF